MKRRPTMSRLITSMVALSPLTLAACGQPATPSANVRVQAAPPAAPSPSIDAMPRATLLARVSTAAGSTAEFWQLAPGEVLFTESGASGAVPAAPAKSGTRLSALWSAVAPDKPMPNALAIADATARPANSSAEADPALVPLVDVSPGQPAQWASSPAGEAGSKSRQPQPLDVSPPPGDPNDFCDPTWFYNHLASEYCNSSGLLSYTWCLYDRWLPSVSGSSLVYDKGALCNYRSSDDVILTIDRGGSGSGTWSVPSQSWRTWSFFTSDNCGWFSCSWNLYGLQVFMSGSWGDVQFAGGTCYPHSNCAT